MHLQCNASVTFKMMIGGPNFLLGQQKNTISWHKIWSTQGSQTTKILIKQMLVTNLLLPLMAILSLIFEH